MVKVSFLVTYYNQEVYVEKSINSILAIDKAGFEWEILVGDDGSTDGTVNTVRNYMDKYPDKIRLYVMPREVDKKYNAVDRASENRINLLKKATGDYFCILDGDDYYDNVDFVKKALEIMEDNRRISTVAYKYKKVCGNQELCVEGIMFGGELPKQLYLKSQYTHAGACVFRNSFENDDFELLDRVNSYDDNDIVIYNLRFGNIYSMSDVVYAYRQNSNQNIWTSSTAIERAVIELAGYEADIIYLPMYKKELWRRYCRTLLQLYLHRKMICRLIDQAKFDYYRSHCECDTLSNRIYNYAELRVWNQIKLNCMFIPVMIKYPKDTLKTLLERR